MNPIKSIDIAIPLIVDEQKFSASAYQDAEVYAIGYGDHFYEDGTAVKNGDSITKEDAEKLTRSAVTKIELAIHSCITAPITDYQYAAILSLAYNCGEGKVVDSDLVKLINDGAGMEEIEAAYEKLCTSSHGKYNETYLSSRFKKMKSLFVDTTKTIGDVIHKNQGITLATVATLAAMTVFYVWKATKNKK